jgi:hypothetical protein
MEGDKVMCQFVLFPEMVPWLDAYVLELTTFPNSKYADQVDSTVNAIAWTTEESGRPRVFFDLDVPVGVGGRKSR